MCPLMDNDYGFTQREADTVYFPKKLTAAFAVIGDRMFADMGIKFYHLAVLRVVYSNDGIDQKGIRNTVPFDKSRISVVVRELLDQGFLRDSATGRSSSLHLTELGMKAVSRTNEYRKVVSEEIFGEFTKAEMEFMDEAFQRLNDLLDILGDPVLSQAEKKERFLTKSDDVLKKMKAAGEKEDYEEGYRHVITRLIELQCCLRISI